MAMADYYLCDVCGGKCFYDANLSYDYDNINPITDMPKLGYMGDMAAICDDCAKTHEVIVREKAPAQAAQSEDAPEGFVLVPDADNMTDKQAEAIARVANCCGGIAYDIYRAAIDAAMSTTPSEKVANNG